MEFDKTPKSIPNVRENVIDQKLSSFVIDQTLHDKIQANNKNSLKVAKTSSFTTSSAQAAEESFASQEVQDGSCNSNNSPWPTSTAASKPCWTARQQQRALVQPLHMIFIHLTQTWTQRICETTFSTWTLPNNPLASWRATQWDAVSRLASCM